MTRLDGLTSWHADWSGLRVAVLGLSVTGFAAADTLAELGARVQVFSEAAEPEYEKLLPVIGVDAVIGPLDTVPDALRADAGGMCPPAAGPMASSASPIRRHSACRTDPRAGEMPRRGDLCRRQEPGR